MQASYNQAFWTASSLLIFLNMALDDYLASLHPSVLAQFAA